MLGSERDTACKENILDTEEAHDTSLNSFHVAPG